MLQTAKRRGRIMTSLKKKIRWRHGIIGARKSFQKLDIVVSEFCREHAGGAVASPMSQLLAPEVIPGLQPSVRSGAGGTVDTGNKCRDDESRNQLSGVQHELELSGDLATAAPRTYRRRACGRPCRSRSSACCRRSRRCGRSRISGGRCARRPHSSKCRSRMRRAGPRWS